MIVQLANSKYNNQCKRAAMSEPVPVPAIAKATKWELGLCTAH